MIPPDGLLESLIQGDLLKGTKKNEKCRFFKKIYPSRSNRKVRNCYTCLT